MKSLMDKALAAAAFVAVVAAAMGVFLTVKREISDPARPSSSEHEERPLVRPDPIVPQVEDTPSPAARVPASCDSLKREERVKPPPSAFMRETLDLWDDPEFLWLEWDDVCALVPDEAPYAHPGTLLDAIGSLPSAEDYARAIEDEEACNLLGSLCTLEEMRAHAWRVPEWRRGKNYTEALEAIERARRSAGKALMLRLEHVTSYPHWTLLFELREELENP